MRWFQFYALAFVILAAPHLSVNAAWWTGVYAIILMLFYMIKDR